MKRDAFIIMKGSGITLLDKTTGNATAYTIISPIAKTLRIQRDEAVMQSHIRMDIYVDGYAVVCKNQDDQHYDYSPNKDGKILTLVINDNNEWVVENDTNLEVIIGRREYQTFSESIGTSYAKSL